MNSDCIITSVCVYWQCTSLSIIRGFKYSNHHIGPACASNTWEPSNSSCIICVAIITFAKRKMLGSGSMLYVNWTLTCGAFELHSHFVTFLPCPVLWEALDGVSCARGFFILKPKSSPSCIDCAFWLCYMAQHGPECGILLGLTLWTQFNSVMVCSTIESDVVAHGCPCHIVHPWT